MFMVFYGLGIGVYGFSLVFRVLGLRVQIRVWGSGFGVRLEG